MHTYDTIEPCQSLIKAEWNIVRTCQAMASDTFPERTEFQSCGILFYKEWAFASNGHWVLRIKTEEAHQDTPIYYDYNLDDVIEDYNNFPLPLEVMFSLTSAWRDYAVKIRVQDALNSMDEAYAKLRDKRLYGVCVHVEDNMVTLDLASKKYPGKTLCIPTYANCEYFPDICIQMSYLYKMLELVQPYYHVVELCANTDGSPIIIKAKNPFQGKPDFRFVVGQYCIQV